MVVASVFLLALIAATVTELERAETTLERTRRPISKGVEAQVGIANVAAASAASAAQVQAGRDGIPLQAISTSLLDSQLPNVTWVDASSEAAYATSGKRIVAIAVEGGHVVTAVQPFPGQCNFGLVVTSPSDPIIVTDHLGGTGVFGSNVGSATTHCDVASAPSSWLPVTPKPLSSYAQLQRPEGDCTTSRSVQPVSAECSIESDG